MRHQRLLPALLLPALLLACVPEAPDPTGTGLPDGPGVPSSHEAAWKAELLEERARKDEEFATSETSPMAGTQYLKSDPAGRVFLTREGATFALADEEPPGAVLSVSRREGLWHWQALDREIACRREEDAVPSGASIDGQAIFSLGDLRLRFFPAKDRVTFIIFDGQREEMLAFEHLLYFPPDPAFAVNAEMVPLEDPEVIEVATSRGLKKTFHRYARIQFRLEGSEQELTALKSALDGEGSRDLFIPFRDATTGRETYGAGRFLNIEEPTQKFFVLDFNRAFNPLCNYSTAYNCAFPPRENHLDGAISAGEKAYPH